MRLFVFFASGILEDGSVAFFHMNLSFFQTELYVQGECLVFWLPAFCKTVLCLSYEFITINKRIVFSMKVFVSLDSGIWENGSVAFFHMNLYAFLKQNCFFNESVCFFGFRYFGRRFCGLFSYKFICFFGTECFFQ